jgi:hypothetical protein
MLNSTLMKGNIFHDTNAIRIDHAKGYLLTYHTLDHTFDFDREKECKLYGQENNDSIQICARAVGQSIAVGKSLPRQSRLS